MMDGQQSPSLGTPAVIQLETKAVSMPAPPLRRQALRMERYDTRKEDVLSEESADISHKTS